MIDTRHIQNGRFPCLWLLSQTTAVVVMVLLLVVELAFNSWEYVWPWPRQWRYILSGTKNSKLHCNISDVPSKLHNDNTLKPIIIYRQICYLRHHKIHVRLSIFLSAPHCSIVLALSGQSMTAHAKMFTTTEAATKTTLEESDDNIIYVQDIKRLIAPRLESPQQTKLARNRVLHNTLHQNIQRPKCTIAGPYSVREIGT